MKNSTKFSINNSKIFSFIVMIILKWIFFAYDFLMKRCSTIITCYTFSPMSRWNIA
ncbi:unnamed protein product [Brassica oleracea]